MRMNVPRITLSNPTHDCVFPAIANVANVMVQDQMNVSDVVILKSFP